LERYSLGAWTPGGEKINTGMCTCLVQSFSAMNAVRWGLGHLGAENYILAWISEVSKVCFLVFWNFGLLVFVFWNFAFLFFWITGYNV
jgi:hypothetical protein